MDLANRASQYFADLQARIVAGLEVLDGEARFGADRWRREGGGGGLTRVLVGGALLEKAGVSWSDVHGEVPAELAAQVPGNGPTFRATGVSLVLHPRSPMVPAVHANFRFLERGCRRWFGGGTDLTPTYLWREDAVHFHRTLRAVCDRHDPAYYPRFKRWCDEYFYLPHRGETRGVGGVFFDQLESSSGATIEQRFDFVRDAGDAFLAAWAPIAERRRREPWGDRERQFQLLRRGRYVEFNLLYDRGTTFGLRTGGRTESILMSLPPQVAWGYQVEPAAGSREAELTRYLAPTDWLGGGAG